VDISAVFFDVDDVVLDTDEATEAAIRVMPVAAEIRQTFRHLYQTLITDLRGARTPDYEPLFADIQRWQREIGEIKVFSREVLMAIALERHGQKVTAEAVHGPVDAYWRSLANGSRVFPDAIQVYEKLKGRGIPCSFATNSDGFLRLDEAAQAFRYDPEYSRKRKQQRLSALWAVGVVESQVTIGDPVGKPHAEFYVQAIIEHHSFHGIAIDLSRAVAVGDSLTSDVLPFLEAGVGRGAWLRRDTTAEPRALPGDPRVVTIPSLTALLEVVWPPAAP
jgi:FMN phosphatase YigB (HAD superfamily)